MKKVSSCSLWQKRVRREVADVMQAVDKLVNRHRWNVPPQTCVNKTFG